MDKLKEEILEVLNKYKATMKAEGNDGVCVTGQFEGDYFYFHQADEYGFDE